MPDVASPPVISTFRIGNLHLFSFPPAQAGCWSSCESMANDARMHPGWSARGGGYGVFTRADCEPSCLVERPHN